MNTQLDVAISKFRNEILNSGTAAQLSKFDVYKHKLYKPTVSESDIHWFHNKVITEHGSAKLREIFNVEIRPLVRPLVVRTPNEDTILMVLFGVYVGVMVYYGIELHMFELLGILVKWGWNHPLGGSLLLLITVPLWRPLVILLVILYYSLANTVHPKN